MIELEEINLMKRKARMADNIVSSKKTNKQNDSNQLMLDEEADQTTPFKQKKFEMMSCDEEELNSDKKLLMDSDYERLDERDKANNCSLSTF